MIVFNIDCIDTNNLNKKFELLLFACNRIQHNVCLGTEIKKDSLFACLFWKTQLFFMTIKGTRRCQRKKTNTSVS